MSIGRTSLAWSDWALVAFGPILVLIGLLAAGGHSNIETKIGDSVIAYALPAR